MSDNDNNEETLVRSFTTYQVTPPSKFSFKSSEWTRWIRRFERFRIATELDKKPEEKQVNSLIYTMGDEADDIITSFGLSQEEMKSYETVKRKFENHFIAKRNVIFERAKFNVRVQNEGEPVESFITDLHCLAKYCDFGTLKDQLIRDRIVVGLRNKKLSEKLQLDSTLTLAKATEQARQSEEVKKQQSVIHGQTSHKHDEHNLDSVNKTKNRYGRERFSREKQRKIPDDKAKCTRCLGPHHARKSCPASDSVCNKCAKKGHWAKACRSQPKDHRNKRIGEVSRQEIEENSSEDDAYFLGEVVNLDAISNSSNKPWNAKIEIDNEKFEFKIDSGADVTVMPYTSYQQSKIQPTLKPTKKILMGPCKYKMDCKVVIPS